MLDWLIELDKELLLLCNATHFTWLDNFNFIITSRWLNVFMVLPLLAILAHRRKGLEAVIVILAIALVVLLCDQIASSFFKPTFQRLRPSHDPSLDVVIINNYRCGLYGFISSHAANTFGVAVFLLLLFRHRIFSVAIIMWAVLVSYSRIYLGVHFPGDILVGAVVGVLVGWGIYWLYNRLRAFLFSRNLLSVAQNPYRQDYYARYFAIYIVLLFVILFAISFL